MQVKNFWDLDAWKYGHDFVLEIYQVTKLFPDDERFGITSQLRRASSSITANIAEGFERYHFKDQTKFYYQARGSIAEVQNFLMLAKDLGYIDIEKTRELFAQSQIVAKLVNGLIRANKSK